MAKIIPIGCLTRLDIPVDTVLEEAKGQLEGVILIGYDKEGEVYTASTYADGGEILWLLESAKNKLFNSVE